ncbi:MAG TPA: SWIM zinc finger family protein [Phototrophicaceae bacterium]|nr:SWIM zinc finger family protein [Phototrophicaceae bacterium]
MAKKKSKPARHYNYDDYDFFPPSRPIKVEGGIQSRSQRGAFAANWWAKRWLAVLEGYGIGSRLQRGRSYARSGQVLNIDVQPGEIQARVQGSRPNPYKIEIQVKPLSDAEWEKVLDAISGQAIFAAQLLDGTMPQEIESAFDAARIPLFPRDPNDISSGCSCPDYANPCKHIAAVYYLLGEQFDFDPFLMFALRGRTREQIIEALRQRRAAAAGKGISEATPAEVFPAALALTDQMEDFWGNEALHWTPPRIASPELNAPVLRRLGSPPGELKKPLEALYQTVTLHIQAQISGSDETVSKSI